MINETRFAEHGGVIIADTTATTFTRPVIAIKCLIATVVAAIAPRTDTPTNKMKGKRRHSTHSKPDGER